MANLQALWGEAIGSGEMAQAYLLVGADGASAVSQFLLRLVCATGESCGECIPCRKVANRTHPDIQHIAKDGKRIKIDQIRELQSDSRYPPLEAKRKVYVLYGAEDLSNEAANSLLKILESPPPYLVFLLTAESTNILPTILSRCQTLRLSPASIEAQAKELAERGFAAQQIDIGLGLVAGFPERFDKLLTIIQMGPSLAEMQQNVQGKLKDLKTVEAIEFFNETTSLLEEREAALQLLSRLRGMNDFEILEMAQALSKLPVEKSQFFLEEALRWRRDLLLVADSKSPSGLLFNRDQLEILTSQAAGLKAEKITREIYDLERGREVFQGNANLQLFFESLLFKLA